LAIKRPFELSPEELHRQLEDMVDAVFSDLVSEFLLMPMGKASPNIPISGTPMKFLNVLAMLLRISPKPREQRTKGKQPGSGSSQSILGMTAPEWAELARSELNSDITQVPPGLSTDIAEKTRVHSKVLSRYQDRSRCPEIRPHPSDTP